MPQSSHSLPVNDRRSDPRHVPVLQLASVQTEEQSQLGLVLNISRSGMKMRRLAGLRVGQQVIVRLRNQDLEGALVWQNSEKIGIAFDEPLSAEELQSLLAPAANRTRAPRLETRREVTVRIGATLTRAVLRNVSPSGAMLQVRMPTNAEPLLILNLPNVGQVLGQVRWADGERIGILFSQALSLTDLARLTAADRSEFNDAARSDALPTEAAG